MRALVATALLFVTSAGVEARANDPPAAPPASNAQGASEHPAARQAVMSQEAVSSWNDDRIIRETRAWWRSLEDRDATLDEDVTTLVEIIVRERFLRRADGEMAAMLALVEKLRQDPHAGPIATVALLIAQIMGEKTNLVTRTYDKALVALREDGAPDVLIWRAISAPRYLAGVQNHRYRPSAAVEELRTTLLIDALKRNPKDPTELLLLTEQAVNFLNAVKDERCEQLVAEVRAMEGALDPCLRETILGEWENRLAWKARGGDWARNVTPRQWEKFNHHLALAYPHLVAAWRADPSRPFAADSLVDLGRAGALPEGETIVDWFERAVTAQPDYFPVYSTMAWSITPRWGGSIEALEALARRAADSTSTVPSAQKCLFTVLEVMAEDSDRDPAFLRSPTIRDRIERVTTRYLATEKSAEERGRLRAWRVLAAWAAKDEAKLFAEVSAPDFILESPIFAHFDIDVPPIEREAWARSSALQADFDAARQRRAEGRPADAVRSLEALLDSQPADAPKGLLAAIREHLALARLDLAFVSDEWTEIAFEPSFVGWRQQAGMWQIDREGIEGTMDRGEAWLATLVPTGPRFAVRTKVALRPTGKEWTGVAFHLLPEGHGAASCHMVSLSLPEAKLRIEALPWAGKMSPSPIEIPIDAGKGPKTVQLEVRVWDGKASVLLDDAVKWAGTLPALARHSGHSVALGGFGKVQGRFHARFRDVALRRLSSVPAEIATAQE